jgi:hypothetical protein
VRFIRQHRRLATKSLVLVATLVVVLLASGCLPANAPSGGVSNIHDHPFLVCTRRIESRGNYGAVNASGTYRGAYQFSRSTWDSTARHAGWPHLVGVDPAKASPADQDAMALHLYQWQGSRPWGGRCG